MQRLDAWIASSGSEEAYKNASSSWSAAAPKLTPTASLIRGSARQTT